MLVYATDLWLTHECRIGRPVDVLAGWLRNKLRMPLNGEALFENTQKEVRGMKLETWIADGAFPVLFSARFQEPDRVVRGRTWRVEMGLQQGTPAGEIRCTVQLSMDDVSPLLMAHMIQPSAPRFIAEIAAECPLSPRTVGFAVRQLGPGDVAAFPYAVNRLERRHPLVLVSPYPDGSYAVDPERLARLLVGIAEVVCIAPETNTYQLAEVVGRSYAAWRGAINIIWPPSRRGDGPTQISSFNIVPRILEEFGKPQERLSYVLGRVVHRTNVHLAGTHVPPRQVRITAEARERRLERERRRAESLKTGELAEYVTYLETLQEETERQVTELQEQSTTRAAERDQLEELLMIAEDEHRQTRFEFDGLKEALAAAGGRKAEPTGDLSTVRKAVLALADRKQTPRQCLEAVLHLYSDSVIVLDSAWKSADQSAGFRHVDQLFPLLATLAGSYRDALAGGSGDGEARKLFGSKFAATESDLVKTNERARDARTFLYRGQPVEMMAHLKCGTVKDSVAESLRVHFHWDAEEKKVVIGHCGPHLPLPGK